MLIGTPFRTAASDLSLPIEDHIAGGASRVALFLSQIRILRTRG
jgi:hypothetical protein